MQDFELTDNDVVLLYRSILGREPESYETVLWFKDEKKTFLQGRRCLLDSEEFNNLNPSSSRHQYYIPELSPLPFVKSEHKLGLATIVKNEAFYIQNMLVSCAPIIDHAVIVDTGSDDKTIEIAREVLTNLRVPFSIDKVPFEDFSQARNAALERVPAFMDWIIMLDADEEFVASDFARFAPLMETQGVDGWFLPRYGFPDLAKRRPVTPYPDFQLRLLRNRQINPIRFSGRVHEQPHNVVGRKAPTSRSETGEIGGPHIHHLGYMDITQDKWQKKHDFYTSLQNILECSTTRTG